MTILTSPFMLTGTIISFIVVIAAAVLRYRVDDAPDWAITATTVGAAALAWVLAILVAGAVLMTGHRDSGIEDARVLSSEPVYGVEFDSSDRKMILDMGDGKKELPLLSVDVSFSGDSGTTAELLEKEYDNPDLLLTMRSYELVLPEDAVADIPQEA